MNEVKWIKISLGIFDDSKIKLIEAMPDADTILVIWIKLLVLAGAQNDSGEIFLNESIPYTDDMLANIFHRKVSVVKLALLTFAKFGMIQILENQSISITNWSKHQNVDGLDKIRQAGKDRAQRFRDAKKVRTKEVLLLEDKEEDIRVRGATLRNVSVTLRSSKSRPSAEKEVVDFCVGVGLTASDGEHCWHKWMGNGFTNKKNKIADWRSTIRSWKSAGYFPSQKESRPVPEITI